MTLRRRTRLKEYEFQRHVARTPRKIGIEGELVTDSPCGIQVTCLALITTPFHGRVCNAHLCVSILIDLILYRFVLYGSSHYKRSPERSLYKGSMWKSHRPSPCTCLSDWLRRLSSSSVLSCLQLPRISKTESKVVKNEDKVYDYIQVSFSRSKDSSSSTAANSDLLDSANLNRSF
jgi:hypothetical protein